jgi:hypothetical protein
MVLSFQKGMRDGLMQECEHDVIMVLIVIIGGDCSEVGDARRVNVLRIRSD